MYRLCSDVEDGESWDAKVPKFREHRRQALLLPDAELQEDFHVAFQVWCLELEVVGKGRKQAAITARQL